MGRYITTTGTAGTATVTITANYTASGSERILADVSSNALTITLTSDPLDGDIVQVIDVTGSASTNNITIARNSKLIQGATEDLTIDIDNSITTLVYTGSTYGWVVGSV